MQTMILLVGALLADAPPGAIDREVRSALQGEQDAFFSRDCERVLPQWADGGITMYVEGRSRATSKAELAAVCRFIMASLPPGAEPPADVTHRVHVLSPDIAYTISERSQSGAARQPVTVTKVLVRRDGQWRILHMHESIGPKGQSGSSATAD